MSKGFKFSFVKFDEYDESRCLSTISPWVIPFLFVLPDKRCPHIGVYLTDKRYPYIGVMYLAFKQLAW